MACTALAVTVPNSGPARAQDATWRTDAGSGNLAIGSNWTSDTVPTGTATFGTSTTTALTLNFSDPSVNNPSGFNGEFGGWTFAAGASDYTVLVALWTPLSFTGAGITINGGSATITNRGVMTFYNSSSAGSANITNNREMEFRDSSSAGSATITNSNGRTVEFNGSSTAGTATITNGEDGTIRFNHNSTAGSAALINNRGGWINFVGTGPNGDRKVSAGSIAGQGQYLLLGNELTVGSNNLSTEVSGVIAGEGGSLVKIGTGTLTLSGTNTYDSGTTIRGGLINFNAANAFGTGAIALDGGGLQWATGTTTDISARLSALGNNGGTFDTNGNNVSFASPLTGSGGLTKTGSGTLTLTGANTYSGGTTISGGTLQIGNGGTSGSIAGNVVNNGVLAFNRSDAVTFAGNISGTGSLTKTGSNTLTLTGTNSYSGGTTISAGTLVGNAASLQGNIVNNAALVFDQAATGTYAGVISGSGSITKTGAGQLILTGDSSAFAGTTDLVAGLLTINGALGGVINFSGGTLGGSGSLGNITVASGASIAPGNSIGTLNVANITMAAGSTYDVELNNGGFVAGTNNDFINATGTATINGGTVRVTPVNGTDNGSTYTPGTYTILSAAGGVTGTFTTLTDDYAFLNFTLGYEANRVTLTSSYSATSFCLAGMKQNQCATGDAAFSFRSGGMFSPLLSLTTAQAPVALDQLSGEAHASFKTALVEDSRFLRNAANDRLRAVFDADGAGETVAPHDGVSFWSHGFGAWGETRSDGNAAQLSRNTGGMFIGADAPVFDTWRFGAVAGYSQTSVDVKDRNSSGSSDNYHVGLYGGAAWNDVAFRTGATYTWHDISTHRSVAFPGFSDRLTGGYNAATAQMFGEFAYGFSTDSARFEPFANLAYVNLHTHGFTEQGGAAALTGASANTDATFTTLGLRASTTFAIGGNRLIAKGMLGWRHGVGDMVPASTMRFAGGGNAFSIGGVPIARNAAVVEARLDYAVTPDTTLGLSYLGQFGSGMADQSARFNLNVKF